MFKHVKAVHYISNLFYDLNIERESAVIMLKQELMCKLLKEYPANKYQNISFIFTKPTESELTELVEHYKVSYEKYLYNGEYVSREFLEEELKDRDYKLYLFAEVEEILE